jgi:hypothetical protein
MLFELLDDLLDVWNHGDLDFAINGEVERHAKKVFMDLASTDFHFSRAIVEEAGEVERHAEVFMDLASTDFHFSRAIVEEAGEVERHAEVFMDLASTDFHFSRAIVEESFIGALQPIDNLGNDVDEVSNYASSTCIGLSTKRWNEAFRISTSSQRTIRSRRSLIKHFGFNLFRRLR